MLSQLQPVELFALALAAVGIGFSKSGFAGVSMLHVVVFAHVFGARASTGILLPLLIVGDLCAVFAFGQRARWQYFPKILPPTLIGVVLGTVLMQYLDEHRFKPLVGVIILLLTFWQLYRLWRPDWLSQVPHSVAFAWALGLLAGLTTMLANAAGPIVALYLLALALPKLELVGTGAWLFLIVNVFKLPLSCLALDLISWESLSINLILAPAVPVGMLLGAWCLHRIHQTWFNGLLLAFTGLASMRLLGWL